MNIQNIESIIISGDNKDIVNNFLMQISLLGVFNSERAAAILIELQAKITAQLTGISKADSGITLDEIAELSARLAKEDLEAFYAFKAERDNTLTTAGVMK